MKIFKSIGLFCMAMSAVLCLASCHNYDEDIDDLNNKFKNIDGRVTTLQSQVESINSQLSKLSVLSKAVEAGFYVTSVRTTDDGYELTLSNGQVIDLQNGPENTVAFAPYISITVIGGIHYWTINGMLITDANGQPMPATGQTPIVRYNTTIKQWTISIDGGMTFQSLNVFASIVINDEVLLQVINNYVSQHSTTLISQNVLYQIISTYIQQNYSKVFNINILRQVIVEYLDLHYTTIFNYELLEQIFNQYNFEYASQHIDVDVITNILITFIQEHKDIFINTNVLYEVMMKYIEENKVEIFNDVLVMEVINNYIQNHTDFINVELMTQIINNYIDQHQDVIFNNEVFVTILNEYVQNNYVQIFSQDILYQVINSYVVQNKTTIFNETLISEIINVYVQNNFNTIISNEILYEIINNYITLNKTTIIDQDILYQVIYSYFQTNYNIIIDETLIQTIINNYVSTHRTEIIDIDIVRYVVKNYVQQNINVIFDVDILNQLIVNYFEQNTTIIKQYVSEYTGIIKDVVVKDDCCVVTLSNGQTIQLPVYDIYANVRDRVQSIVVIPNANGHITHPTSYDYIQIDYLVTPASMAEIIAKDVNDQITVSVVTLDVEGCKNEYPVNDISASEGRLSVNISELRFKDPKVTAISLHVSDNCSGGTDYMTSFTPIDWTTTY